MSSDGILGLTGARHGLHVDEGPESVDGGREGAPWRLLAVGEARDGAERCDGVPGSRRVGDGENAGNGRTGRGPATARFPPAGTALSIPIAPAGLVERVRSLASSLRGHAVDHSRKEGTGV